MPRPVLNCWCWSCEDFPLVLLAVVMVSTGPDWGDIVRRLLPRPVVPESTERLDVVESAEPADRERHTSEAARGLAFDSFPLTTVCLRSCWRWTRPDWTAPNAAGWMAWPYLLGLRCVLMECAGIRSAEPLERYLLSRGLVGDGCHDRGWGLSCCRCDCNSCLGIRCLDIKVVRGAPA